MTATITSLLKRLDKLDYTAKEPDLIELAIAKLSDKDLELLHEHTALRESGFDEGQTAQMMGKRYNEALKAAARFQKWYDKLDARTDKQERAICPQGRTRTFISSVLDDTFLR